jgi:hypothetical protein
MATGRRPEFGLTCEGVAFSGFYERAEDGKGTRKLNPSRYF